MTWEFMEINSFLWENHNQYTRPNPQNHKKSDIFPLSTPNIYNITHQHTTYGVTAKPLASPTISQNFFDFLRQGLKLRPHTPEPRGILSGFDNTARQFLIGPMKSRTLFNVVLTDWIGPRGWT